MTTHSFINTVSLHSQRCTFFALIANFLLLSATFAQKNISSAIFSVSNQAIPYMNIGILGTSIGTVSNSNGEFKLSIPNENLNDTILFSALGFKNRLIPITSLMDSSIVFEHSIQSLNEVEIRPGGFESKTIGNKNISTNRKVNFALSNKPNQNLGSEIAKKFNIPKNSYLENVQFYLSRNNFDTALLRINIREIKNELPGNNLNNENILIQVYKSKGQWIEVDLSQFSIKVEGKFAIGIEWIAHSKNGKVLSLPISVPSIGSTHFYKYASASEWKKYGQLSAAIMLTYSN